MALCNDSFPHSTRSKMSARLAVPRPTQSSKLLSASKDKSLSAVTLTKKTVRFDSLKLLHVSLLMLSLDC